MRITRKLAALLAIMALALAACGDGTADSGDDDGTDPVTSDDDAGDDAGDDATVDDAGDDDAEADDDDDVATDDDDDDGDDDDGDDEAGGELSGDLDGAGASFPDPVFQDWIDEYTIEVQPGVSMNYNSVGSGAGIQQFLEQTVDYGSTERFMTDDEIAEAVDARGCDPLQLPVLFGAVELAFGDEDLEDLTLDAETIAGIFQGEITNYSDDAIASLNPDFDLPDRTITPVRRSDSSGTTNVFTLYLDDAAPNWELGAGSEIEWPDAAIGGQQNDGVAAGIAQNEGGIGYVNQAYALLQGLPTAQVLNADGNPVKGTIDATVAAIENVEIPDDYGFAILDVGGDGYPIAGANWVLFYECGYDDNTAELLRDFWTWAISSDEANAISRDLGYVPLEGETADRVLADIERIGSLD